MIAVSMAALISSCGTSHEIFAIFRITATFEAKCSIQSILNPFTCAVTLEISSLFDYMLHLNVLSHQTNFKTRQNDQ